MLYRALWRPGAINANTAFDLPSGAPNMVSVASARIFRSQHLHVENTAGAYTQNANTNTADGITEVAAVPTRVDSNSLQLNVALLAGDLLELVYIPEGTRLRAA